MSNENEKKCSNCKYFMPHYVCIKGRYKAIHGAGHCSNVNIRYNTKCKTIAKNCECKFWVTDEERLKENEENLKVLLNSVLERLKLIASMLEQLNS